MKRKLMLILIPAVVALSIGAALPALAHEGGNDFVCPVFNDNAAVGDHNPNAVMIGDGHYTVIPGLNTGIPRANHLDVPDQATNSDGTGSPPGPHSSPGDPDYTAIWNGD
jgi:hypothetical protein